MKAKRGFVIASTVFVGINLILFFALWLYIIIANATVQNLFLKWIRSVGTQSDFGYWLNTELANNVSGVVFFLIVAIFLLIAAKIAYFYQFVKYARYNMKDFYTRRGKYLTITIIQFFFLLGSFFGMLCGITAIVIQKALVTPDRVNQVLNGTWGQDDIAVGQGNATPDNKPVVRVGPNAKFVENISQLRDGVRYLFEANLISAGQRKSLNKKIDKLSKDKARQRSVNGNEK